MTTRSSSERQDPILRGTDSGLRRGVPLGILAVPLTSQHHASEPWLGTPNHTVDRTRTSVCPLAPCPGRNGYHVHFRNNGERVVTGRYRR